MEGGWGNPFGCPRAPAAEGFQGISCYPLLPPAGVFETSREDFMSLCSPKILLAALANEFWVALVVCS